MTFAVEFYLRRKTFTLFCNVYGIMKIPIYEQQLIDVRYIRINPEDDENIVLF